MQELMQELKFDHEAHAALGLYVPPLETALHDPNWLYVGGILKEKQGFLWVEEIPEAAFMKGKIIPIARSVDVNGIAFVHRIDGKEAQGIFAPGDCVMMSGHALGSGMRLPGSEEVAGLRSNLTIRIIDGANVQYCMRQQHCKAHYETQQANKKALADTQAKIAAKNAPEKE